MISKIQKSVTAFCLLAAMLALPFTAQRVYAQGDGTAVSDGTGHWDWVDSPPPANGCHATVINISTGVDNSGTPMGVGSPDPNWSCPSGMGSVVTPVAGWGSFTGSRWLGSTSLSTPAGNYNYVRNFTIPGGAVGTINFQAIADNYVQIYLDGTLFLTQTPGLTIYGFQNTYLCSYTGVVGPGSHYITAIVHNEDSQTGLDLSGTVSYTITNSSTDISTGMVNFLPLSIGAPDPNWSVSPAGYNNVTVPNWSWDVFTGSQWLGDGNSYIPAGNYTYNRSFSVPASGGIISFEAMADNYVEFFLDGSSTPFAQTPALTIYGFLLANKVTFSGAVSGGAHTIHAKVFNEEACLGLNVHGSVAYCNPDYNNTTCITDPYFAAAHTGYNTVSFYSSTNPMNTSTLYATVTHYWDFGDGGNSTLANPVYYYGMPGSYLVTHTVTKTIANPWGIRTRCSSTQTCWVTIDEDAGIFWFDCGHGDPSGKQAAVTTTLAAEGPFAIFPNPAHDQLKISRQLNGCDLSIFGMDGRTMVHIGNFTGTAIDISGLAPGSYMLKVVQNNQVNNLKFSKVE